MSFRVAESNLDWNVSVEQKDKTRVLVKVNGVEIFRFWETSENRPVVSAIYSERGLRKLGFECEGGKVKVF